LAESAHDLSDGGLAVALAECSFGPAGVGARLELDSDLRPEFLLFHEGPSRVLISTEHPGEVAGIAARHGVESSLAGVTLEGKSEIRNRKPRLVWWDVDRLRSAYTEALERKLRA
jgi:phosphoribosylformylglycinamidine synthase subunit PurL